MTHAMVLIANSLYSNMYATVSQWAPQSTAVVPIPFFAKWVHQMKIRNKVTHSLKGHLGFVLGVTRVSSTTVFDHDNSKEDEEDFADYLGRPRTLCPWLCMD